MLQLLICKTCITILLAACGSGCNKVAQVLASNCCISETIRGAPQVIQSACTVVHLDQEWNQKGEHDMYNMLRSLAPLCTVHSVYKLIQLDARAQKLRRRAVTEGSSYVCTQNIYIMYISLCSCTRIYVYIYICYMLISGKYIATCPKHWKIWVCAHNQRYAQTQRHGQTRIQIPVPLLVTYSNTSVYVHICICMLCRRQLNRCTTISMWSKRELRRVPVTNSAARHE